MLYHCKHEKLRGVGQAKMGTYHAGGSLIGPELSSNLAVLHYLFRGGGGGAMGRRQNIPL